MCHASLSSWTFLFFPSVFVAGFLMCVLGQMGQESVPTEKHDVTAPIGSRLKLRCQSKRLVAGRDRLGDQQRVVHWDLFRGGLDHPQVERILDMFPSGDRRLYNELNKGRVNISKTAFVDGNFSLVIKGVSMNDRGIYTCHLHHHYCNLNETLKMQLNVTKSARKERHFWDGEKFVFVVLLNSTMTLPCVNRRPLWTRRQRESERQVVHWDVRAPWALPSSAERLVDLYSAGEPLRQHGSLFQPHRMSVPTEAFTLGDFSLTISEVQPPDEAIYICHMNHQYCGLRKSITYYVTVGPPLQPVDVPDKSPSTSAVDAPVVNVIISKHGSYLYILTILLIVIVIVVIFIVLLTCQFRKRGLDYHLRRTERGNTPTGDAGMGSVELKMCNQALDRPDYKNNIWKERVDVSKLPSPKVIDLDTEMERRMWN
uniref:Matrix remodeling-associated protein 8 n=1 Tax=Paramormyrops kingsleyae TaxID=1676925 RepID=A0A3B3SBW9_9TELE